MLPTSVTLIARRQRSVIHAASNDVLNPQVTEEGEYVPPPAANSKASYATMVYVRATIVEDAGWLLARSVTIAVRTVDI